MPQFPAIQPTYAPRAGLQAVFPAPLVMQRAPTASDRALPGTVWVDNRSAARDAYILTGIFAGSAAWVNAGGGAGAFAALVVNPGPVTIDSTLTTITATANVADVFKLTTGGAAGATSTFTITNTTGTSTDAIKVASSVGGVHLASGLANADAINLESTAGGVHLESAAQMLIESSEAAAADSVEISATALDGGVTFTSGTGGITETTTGTISLTSTKNAAPAILINANGGAAETVVISSTQGTSATSVGMSSTLGGIVLETAAAAKDVVLNAVLGSIEITGREAAADAVRIAALNAAGGIDVDAGTAGIAADSTGSITLTSTNNAVNALYLHANGGAAETVRIESTLGTTDISVNMGSQLGGVTIETAAAGKDIVLSAVGGSIHGNSGEAVNDAIAFGATNGGITLSATAAAGVRVTNGVQTAQILVGTGSPNGAVTGLQGSIFLNVAGGADTILYVNTDGAMGWTALTST